MSDDDYHQQWMRAFHHHPLPAHPAHDGKPVPVGRHVIHAGGTRYLRPEHLDGFDLLVPLTDRNLIPIAFRRRYRILAAPLPDLGGVPKDWPELVREVIAALEEGQRVLAFCMEGHGRTGCLLGSLIAVLESADQTPDPIVAVRQRHCPMAVETPAQAAAIFALRGRPLPADHAEAFCERSRLERALFEQALHRHVDDPTPGEG